MVYTDTEEKPLGTEWPQMENGQVARKDRWMDGWLLTLEGARGNADTSSFWITYV